jgi:hypothetical protein
MLPKSLEYIVFGTYFRQKIKYDVLPKSLKYIIIHKNCLDEDILNNKDIKVMEYTTTY